MQNKSFIATILILILAIPAIALISLRKPPKVIQTNLENIPMQIKDYTATDDSFPQSVYDELNADKHIYRHYRSPQGQVIDLYIGYYGTAKGGRTGHNPYACLPGAGWGIVRDEKVTIAADGMDKQYKVNFTTTQKNEIFNVMIHWYHSAGTKVLGSGLEQNIQRFISQITKNRNDGAFIRISASASKNEIEKVRLGLNEFAAKILTLLPQYWPVEKEA